MKASARRPVATRYALLAPRLRSLAVDKPSFDRVRSLEHGKWPELDEFDDGWDGFEFPTLEECVRAKAAAQRSEAPLLGAVAGQPPTAPLPPAPLDLR